MSIIQAVTDYISACPLLEDGYMHVDFLGSDPVEYVIEKLATDPIVRRYVDGSAVMRYDFAIGSREYFSVDALQNIENNEFYEELQSYFMNKSRLGQLPALDTGLTAQKLEPIADGYVVDVDGLSARYQMQWRLTYFKEA